MSPCTPERKGNDATVAFSTNRTIISATLNWTYAVEEYPPISRKQADKTNTSPASPLSDKAVKTAAAPGSPPSGSLPVVDDLQSVETMSDEDLMRLCQEGDEGAFGVLFQRYEGPALSFINRLVGDQSRTEALGQEAFLRIFKDAKSYQYPRSFTTWFYTIVRNLCKNELRWRSRHPTVSIEDNLSSSHGGEDSARVGDYLQSEATSPLDEMVIRERDQRLEKALEMLPEAEREVLILNRFQGLKYREIAEVIGVPVGTVRARIYSALERLRKAIKDYV